MAVPKNIGEDPGRACEGRGLCLFKGLPIPMRGFVILFPSVCRCELRIQPDLFGPNAFTTRERTG